MSHVEWVVADGPILKDAECVPQGTSLPNGSQVEMEYALLVSSERVMCLSTGRVTWSRTVALEGSAQELMNLLERLRLLLGEAVADDALELREDTER